MLPMTRAERLARTDEVDRFADWLVDYGADKFLDYHHARTAELDMLAVPISAGSILEVHVAGIAYRVRVEGPV